MHPVEIWSAALYIQGWKANCAGEEVLHVVTNVPTFASLAADVTDVTDVRYRTEKTVSDVRKADLALVGRQVTCVTIMAPSLDGEIYN